MGSPEAPNLSDDLRIVYSGQKFLIGSLFVLLLLLPLYFGLNFAIQRDLLPPEAEVARVGFHVVGFVARLFGAFGIFRMGKVLYPGVSRYLFPIGTFLPYVGLFVIFIANGRAINYFKSHGWEVGYFGAKKP